MPCHAPLVASPPIRPDWPQSINQSFRGSMRLGQPGGNHLDGDGAWQESPAGPQSSYCRRTPCAGPSTSSVFKPSPIHMGQAYGRPALSVCATKSSLGR